MVTESLASKKSVGGVVGSLAPDMAVTNTAGESVMLSEFWREKPLVLVFLRHFGCAFCKELAMQLRADYGKFKAVGANVVCVGIGPYKAGRAFQILYDLPFEVLTVGDDLSVYQAYGLTRATLETTVNRIVVYGILRNVLRGNFNSMLGKTGDKGQLGGAFVINPGGVVLYASRANNPSQLPTTTNLLDHLPRA